MNKLKEMKIFFWGTIGIFIYFGDKEISKTKIFNL